MSWRVSPQARRRSDAISVAQLDGVDAETKRLLIESMLARDSRPALQADRVVYRVVVVALGTIGIGAILCVAVLMLNNQPRQTVTTDKGTTTTSGMTVLPDIFLALGSAAVGALAGLLAPSPNAQSGGAQPVPGATDTSSGGDQSKKKPDSLSTDTSSGEDQSKQPPDPNSADGRSDGGPQQRPGPGSTVAASVEVPSQQPDPGSANAPSKETS